MSRTLIADLLHEKPLDSHRVIGGWLRTKRDSKKGFSFLEVNDGSCLRNLQVIADAGLANYDTEIKRLTTGCCLRITGHLVPSPARGQQVELQANEVEVLGWADPDTYPLQKKRHSFEFLRSISHLRPRTNTLGAVARIRSELALAIHRFFRERRFQLVHTPIITTSDCEGAGEMFRISGGDRTAGQEFFGTPANLTVSGQLQAEVYALALGRVYTFGPTFRAENSHTSRHLSEFWMVEPEMAFCDLRGDMDLAEEFLKFLVEQALSNCLEDLELFNRFIDRQLLARLSPIPTAIFQRLDYTEAIDILVRSGRRFEYPPEWGCDLQAEHERYLTEEVFKGPVIVTDYPASIKPFYMRLNRDGGTVAAMDILFPGIGEIVGGSQREERYDVLAARLNECGMDRDQYQWYLDLRRYGTVIHAGFGLGFERFIQFITGMTNIRDVIPFPRTPGSASL